MTICVNYIWLTELVFHELHYSRQVGLSGILSECYRVCIRGAHGLLMQKVVSQSPLRYNNMNHNVTLSPGYSEVRYGRDPGFQSCRIGLFWVTSGPRLRAVECTTASELYASLVYTL